MSASLQSILSIYYLFLSKYIFSPRFHNFLIQYFTKFEVNFSEDTDPILSRKSLQCFLKSYLTSQISQFFVRLLIEWKTKLLHSCVFKLVYQPLVMQYFSCPHNSSVSVALSESFPSYKSVMEGDWIVQQMGVTSGPHRSSVSAAPCDGNVPCALPASSGKCFPQLMVPTGSPYLQS